MRRSTLTTLALAGAFFLAACGGAPTQQASVPQAPAGGTAAPTAQEPAPPAPQPAQAEPAAPPKPTATTQYQQPAPAPAPKPTATASAPKAPPKPAMIEVPAGTIVEMELITALSSKTNVPGDPFQMKVIDPIVMGNQVVVPEGTLVEGTVTEAVSAKKMTGQAVLTLSFTKITLPDGSTADISAVLTEKGKKIGNRTAGIVGGSAAGGALLGRIIGGDTKGAVIGAAVGAAAGTGVAAAQKGQELKLPAGTGIAIELANPVQVPAPKSGA